MRRWQRRCLALALLTILIPTGGLAEVGRASTPLDGASPGQRGNIALAVAALDGVLVKKGETFSFNAVVGPRTSENGYVPAINGRGAKKLGGGVSQAATTLYLALKRLEGIQYLEKQTYGNQFAGGYVDTGCDAVVTDSRQNVDFRFENGWGDFVIRMRTTDAAVECELTAPGEAENPAPDVTPESVSGGNGNEVADSTPADGPGANAGAVHGGAPSNGADSDGERGSPSPGDESDGERGSTSSEDAGGIEPVESAIEIDPDVAGFSRIRITGPDAMLENIQLASSGIYGAVLRRGESFSFNALVGPNTEDAGYRKAPDGRGETVVGGGVGVIASGLWLAVRDMDEIDVTQKTTYGAAYNQSYVADQDDAVLTDSEKGVDFRFRYKGRGSITIYAYVLEGDLICEVRRNNG